MSPRPQPRGLPRVEPGETPGKLIVIEGGDGIGRSTQISLLVPWLEANGHATLQTGWNRSLLVSKLITSAKEGTHLNKVTYSLLYATDFADRLERVVIPALRAGQVVVADRYTYAAIARSVVRGVDPSWIRGIYDFAPRPDLVVFMRLDVPALLTRTMYRTRLNYWESGMDQHMGEDMYESFMNYQTRMLQEYDAMAQEYGWTVVDASKTIEETQRDIRRPVGRLVEIPPERIDQRVTPVPLVQIDSA